MSDHEFEKKIQLQMEELKFRPSEAVWMEVERNIRRDKRRRRFLLWIPVAAALLLTGGYLVFSSNQPTSSEVLVKHDTPASSAAPSTSSSQQSNSLSKENSTPPNSSQASGVGSRESSVDSQESVVDSRRSIITTGKTKMPASRLHSSLNRQALSKTNTDTYNNGNKNDQANEPVNVPVVKDNTQQPVQDPVGSEQLAVNNTRQPASGTQQPVTGSQQSATGNQLPATRLPDSIDAETAQLVALNSASTVAKAAAPIEKKPKKGSKWQWGIQAGGGMSNISTERLFGFSNPFSVEKSLVADVASNSPANMYAISINPPVNKKPSSLETGLHYAVGGFVQRSVAKRLKVGAGLQYAFYSVHTQVGQRVDNSQSVNVGPQGSFVVDQFYRNSSPAISRSYTYKYHLIELPVYLNWQINKARHLPPVAWQGGLSLARLVATNALHYDGVSGVYFKDNKLFNKTQVALNSGLEIGLLQKYRFPIWVGPSVGYNVTGLISKEVSNRQFLWSGSVRVKMLLSK